MGIIYLILQWCKTMHTHMKYENNLIVWNLFSNQRYIFRNQPPPPLKKGCLQISSTIKTRQTSCQLKKPRYSWWKWHLYDLYRESNSPSEWNRGRNHDYTWVLIMIGFSYSIKWVITRECVCPTAVTNKAWNWSLSSDHRFTLDQLRERERLYDGISGCNHPSLCLSVRNWLIIPDFRAPPRHRAGRRACEHKSACMQGYAYMVNFDLVWGTM